MVWYFYINLCNSIFRWDFIACVSVIDCKVGGRDKVGRNGYFKVMLYLWDLVRIK